MQPSETTWADFEWLRHATPEMANAVAKRIYGDLWDDVHPTVTAARRTEAMNALRDAWVAAPHDSEVGRG